MREYMEKGAYMQMDMCAKFLASWCPEKGNVRDFLDVNEKRGVSAGWGGYR